MSMPSLADRAVFVLGAIRNLSDLVDNDDPARHVVRSLQREAEAVLDDALRRANGLVWVALDAKKSIERAIAEHAPTLPPKC